MMISPARSLAIALLPLVAGCALPPVNRADVSPLSTVESVDIERYLGRWYEYARLPNGFEKDCEGVTADYARREDGLITVWNACRVDTPDGALKTAKGRARIVDAETNAKLEVSFFGPFWGDYWILDLKDDYSVAIVGEPRGRFLWVLSRTPSLPEEERGRIVERLKALGYDPSALYFPAQPPSPDNPRP